MEFHLQELFYKYTDAGTAKIILTSGKFRFSSPLRFNDPFDIQTDLYSSFNLDELSPLLMSALEGYVRGHIPIPKSHSKLSLPLIQLKNAISQVGYKRSVVTAALYPLIESLEKSVKENLKTQNNIWKKSLRRTHVFCVTEDKDNLLMWAHYAREHTGVVFELANIQHEENVLINVNKVEYVEKPLDFFSLEELTNWALFQVEPDLSKIFYSTHACRKSAHWDYEKEWRVIGLHKDLVPKELHVDYKFIPSQLRSIFFGVNTAPHDVQSITSLAKAINPNIKFYRSVKKRKEYGISFESK